ncbi:hypothetical protein V6N13_080344 [Hibiscus sabdariffa]
MFVFRLFPYAKASSSSSTTLSPGVTQSSPVPVTLVNSTAEEHDSLDVSGKMEFVESASHQDQNQTVSAQADEHSSVRIEEESNAAGSNELSNVSLHREEVSGVDTISSAPNVQDDSVPSCVPKPATAPLIVNNHPMITRRKNGEC